MKTSQQNQADIETALECHRTYLEIDPDNPHLLFKYAELLHSGSHYDDAIITYEKCITLGADKKVIRGRIASVLISQSRFEEASIRLRQLIDEGETAPTLYFNLGLALFYTRDFKNARHWIEKAQSSGIDPRMCQNYRTQCLHHEGRMTEAAKSCREWLTLEDTPDVRGYLSLIELDAGNTNEAVRIAQQVLTENPNNEEAEFVMGTAAMASQNLDEAQAYFTDILKRQDNHARANFGIGLTHLYLQQHQDAIKAMKKALSLDPRNSAMWIALGWTQATALDLRAAEHTFRKTIEVDPNFSEGYGGLGYVLAALHRVDEAKKAIDKATWLDQASFGAAAARSILAGVEGDEERSKRMLAAMLEHKPSEEMPSLMEHIQVYITKQQNKDASSPTKH